MRSLKELALEELAFPFQPSGNDCTCRGWHASAQEGLLCLAVLPSPCRHDRLGLAAHFTPPLHPRSRSKWGNHPLTRAAVGVAVGALLFVLYRHSPDSGKGCSCCLFWLVVAAEPYAPEWAV